MNFLAGEKLESEHRALKQEHMTLTAAHDKLKENHSELHDHVNFMYSKMEPLKTLVSKLRDELQQKNEHNKVLKENCDRMECENRVLKERATSLSCAMEQSRLNAHITITANEKRVKEENEMLIGELKKATDTHESLKDEHEKLKKTLKQETDSAVAYLQERHDSELRDARKAHGQGTKVLKEELTREKGKMQEKHSNLQESFLEIQETLQEEQKKSLSLKQELDNERQRVQCTLRNSIEVLNEVVGMKDQGVLQKCAKQVSLALQNLL